MLDELRADMKHYDGSGGWYRSPGFWVTATYRFGHWSHSLTPAPLRLLCLGLYKAAVLPWRIFKSVSIPAKAKIGPGLCLHHPFNIIIPEATTIGSGCTIYQEVTLGRGPVAGVPTLGDNVTLFAGSKILGGITVGDDVEIGANAVILRDAPTGSIVANPPARTIPREMCDPMRRHREGGP